MQIWRKQLWVMMVLRKKIMDEYHVPVLLNESIEALDIHPNGIYVDCTFGGGGHSQAILDQLDKGRLYAFDRDADADDNRIEDPRFTLIRHDYRWISNFLNYHTAVPVNGILADLGVSSHQLDAGERGFSFRREARLDLRMDRDIENDAAHFLNSAIESRIKLVFARYGEIKNAAKLARRICELRRSSPIISTSNFVQVLEEIGPQDNKKKSKYMAQAFQALRIEVNQELNAIENLLQQCPALLDRGGRMVFITYHSLEDRLVKNFIRSGNTAGKIEKDFYGRMTLPLKAVNRKPILPSEEELTRNPRSRSAKLRIAEKA